MEFYETKMLPGIFHFQLTWYRYVDDVICLFPKDLDPSIFLDKLNELVPSIQFKIELEVEEKLPFLDTLIIKSSNGFKFKVYRKPTHVDSYIHFYSNHHYAVKRSVFSGMFLRALRICEPEYIEEETTHIRKIASNLCYPKNFIEKCWLHAKDKFYENHEKEPFNTKNLLCLPYHKELQPVTSILKSLNINVVFKYESIVKSLLIKNSPTEKDKAGVYFIPCKGCNQIYVGQTGKTLTERCKQHQYNVNTANPSSALFVHKREKDHFIEWENAKIIYTSTSVTERLIAESVLIRVCNTMNISDGLYKLDKVLTDRLTQHPKIKRALKDVSDSNGAVT